MVIKLLPGQIPMFWEAIKYAAVSADGVEEKERGSYLLDLLHSLLNSKAQCFARLNHERRLQALMITKFQINKLSGRKGLLITPLFSWERVDVSEWQEDLLFVKQLAQKEGCEYIAFDSNVPRVWRLGEALGFKETNRRFEFRL